jgi:hypothetical protein
MFDDILMDGRTMSQIWALLQQQIPASLNEDPKVFATPLG